MSGDDIGAPEANTEIHGRLFAIETVLRELIIESLTELEGPKWYQRRLPSECREQFKAGVDRDRTTRWTRNVPHHPVYYIDFPDLRLTIEQKDNWSAAFREIFPKAKELVTTDLVELEFIRNKVAHNRRATDADLEVVRAAYSKLASVLGSVRFAELADRYTVEPEIPQRLSLLRREGDVSMTIAVRGRPLARLDRWHEAIHAWWWFDETYLGYSLARISRYFDSLLEYQILPAASQAELAAWSTQHGVQAAHADTREDFEQILLRWRA